MSWSHSGRDRPLLVHRWLIANFLMRLTASIMLGGSFAYANPWHVQLDHTVELPNMMLGGMEVHAHSQGLLVDDEFFYVTARLEREPKLPIFVRFNRSDATQYEIIDLSHVVPSELRAFLDHPGGFDFDGTEFWIPIARSRPAGPSIIVRVRADSQLAFQEWPRAIAFQTDDHIGALAYHKLAGRLYGASWDTKRIYEWSPDGTDTTAYARQEWLTNAPNWALAVQDWKIVRHDLLASPGTLVASGINRSGRHGDKRASAVVSLLDSKLRRQLAQIQFPAVDGVEQPVTNEGMCLYKEWIVLCPGDIGRGAKLLFFRRALDPAARKQLRDDLVRRLRARGAKVFLDGPEVMEVNGNRTRVSDADLEGISSFGKMTDLSLEQTRITAQGLRHLRGLDRLEWLNLYQCHVGDAGLQVLAELSSLQHLPIGKSGVTDAGLPSLSKLSKLEYLGLRGNPITDGGLKHLRSLSRLQGLNLAETQITDTGLVHLTHLSRLRTLWLNSTRVTNAAVEHLMKLKSLRQLHVSGTEISREAVQDLPRVDIRFE